MAVNEEIKRRRLEVGLADTEAARQVGLSIHEYDDIEQHAREIFEVTELRSTKRICEVLRLDFFRLFNIRCAFCEGSDQYLQYFSTPRNELIRKRRLDLGLSEEELGNSIGFEAIAITDMEKEANYLEAWPIDLTKELSGALKIPVQILIGIKCKRCGR
jgi:DNA-binding XRE family transcriptional regulator